MTSGHLARTVGECAAALSRDDLPTLQDAEAMMPPTSIYWFRRVPGANLWIWFTFDDQRVFLVSLTAKPSSPIDRSNTGRVNGDGPASQRRCRAQAVSCERSTSAWQAIPSFRRN